MIFFWSCLKRPLIYTYERMHFWKKRVFINTKGCPRPKRLIYSWRFIANTDATTVAVPVQSHRPASPGTRPVLGWIFPRNERWRGRGHGKVRIDCTGSVLRRINRVQCVVPGRPTVFTSRRDKHVPFARKQNDISHWAWTERCDSIPARTRTESDRNVYDYFRVQILSRPFPSVRVRRRRFISYLFRANNRGPWKPNAKFVGQVVNAVLILIQPKRRLSFGFARHKPTRWNRGTRRVERRQQFNSSYRPV